MEEAPNKAPPKESGYLDQIYSAGNALSEKATYWKDTTSFYFTSSTGYVKDTSIAGINKALEYGEAGKQSALNGYTAVKETLRPTQERVEGEVKEFKRRFFSEIIKQQSLPLRRSFVNYSTFAIFFASFLMLKRGYLRYSLTKSVIYYGIASYAICPENLNWFDQSNILGK
ncbi:hypothetical protein FGO68_gene3047 [Halteria grandinella]|uniref:Uncharacterized protein n=1 Tax=Halteria grandinella TaxID=5974 RepID=A0A8J8P1Z1_HALGN|nr:hypothetical protein FGO68_gene3047 [Halteria grandinella]